MYRQKVIVLPTPIEPQKMLEITLNSARSYGMLAPSTSWDDLRILDYNEIVPLDLDTDVYVHLKKEHADALMEHGTIKFGTLRSFRESEDDHSRDRNEGAIITWIVNKDFSYIEVGAIGDYNHVYCTSLTPKKNERLRKFGESTVRIKNPNRFWKLVSEHIEMTPVRLSKVIYAPLNAVQLKTDKVCGLPRALEAPKRDQLEAQIALAFIKRPEFSPEQECRFMWVSESGQKVGSKVYQIPQLRPLLERVD